MMYNSLAEVFTANEEVRRRLVERVEGLSEEQRGARGAGGGWCASDIVEHLSLTERRITRALEGMLRQAADEGAAASSTFTPFSLDAYVKRASAEKYEAPEYIRPRGVPLDESLAHLKESRAALESLRPRFDAADLSAQFPHPAFGPLNLAQWLAFIGIHEERHLRQLERVLGETQNAQR